MSAAVIAIGRAVRIGTRGSALARIQAGVVADAMCAAGIDHELVIVTTAGDQRAPDTAWGEGAFVTAIERALVEGEIDVAVHSAKDMPTEEDPRLAIAAYLRREEPRDALVLPAGQTGSLAALPAGTVVGTDSPRRTGFLRAYRRDLVIRPLHGNVDTRLRRLDDGEVGALLLAAAGLIRLGRRDRISELVAVDVVPPAPGQGAIAVQIRANDRATTQRVAALDDAETRIAVEAERAFLKGTGGGCRAPIGALATVTDGRISLLGGFATLDGRARGLEHIDGPATDRDSLAATLADRLTTRRANIPDAPRVLVTRPEHDARRIIARLSEYGIATSVVPAIDIELEPADGEINTFVRELADYDWTVVTSANGAGALATAAEKATTDLSAGRWAAVGGATARALRAAGAIDVWSPSQANATTLAHELPVEPTMRVLRVRGDIADDSLETTLRERGASVDVVTAYRTIVGPAASRPALEEAMRASRPSAVIFASTSAVAGLLKIAADLSAELRAVTAICVGPRTAQAARAAGFHDVIESPDQDAALLAELAARAVSSSNRTSVEEPLT